MDRELAYYHQLGQRVGGVTFVTYGGQDDAELATTLEEDVSVLNNRWSYSPRWFGLFAGLHYRKELRQVSIIKTNQLLGAGAAILAKALSGARLVVRCGYVHSLVIERNRTGTLKHRMRVWLEEWAACRAAERVMVSNHADADFLIQKYGCPLRKISIIPNFVQTDLFSPKPAEVKRSGLVGYVGRLEQEKNLSALIDAASKVRGITVRIIGSGTLQEELETQARDANVKVEFLGNVQNPLLPTLLRECEVFVFPSLFEGHPKALLEAMACGLPVVTTPVEGIRSVIQHGQNGYLCDNTTADAIRCGLEEVMSSAELRQKLGRGARRYVVENLSIEKVLAKELDVYQQLGFL